MIDPTRYRETMQRLCSVLQGTADPDTRAVRAARVALRAALADAPEGATDDELFAYRERALAAYEEASR